MCDVRLFKSAFMDYQLVKTICRTPYNDEMFLNNAAYHLQQCVEKVTKGALECVGVTVPNTHRLSRLFRMVHDNGANLIITDWLDDHAEMLSEWEAECRYNITYRKLPKQLSIKGAKRRACLITGFCKAGSCNMDFLVEKRKLDAAVERVDEFLKANGIQEELREELHAESVKSRLLSFLPEEKKNGSAFEQNCYYIMFAKRLKKD